jgi:uncharacterized protein (TIGR03067 family)
MSKSSKARSIQPGATLGHLEDCWDEPCPTCKDTRTELERLQGAWTCMVGKRRAAFLLLGNRFAVHFAEGDVYMGIFEVGPGGSPRTMDVRIEEGPAHHRGQTALCIYELDGDVLRWCTAGPGRQDRPAAFPAEGDPQFLCLVFRREQRRGALPG